MQAQGKSHQGVLYGQIAAVLGVVVVGVWGATQWTATALGHQARLGTPWFEAFGSPVYRKRGLKAAFPSRPGLSRIP